MGLVEPYRGRYYSASSALEYLDINTIFSGCNSVEQEANILSDYAGDLTDISSTLGPKELSLDGETVGPLFEECSTGIVGTENTIVNLTTQIRELAEVQYNEIQNRLNSGAQARDEAECRRRESMNNEG